MKSAESKALRCHSIGAHLMLHYQAHALNTDARLSATLGASGAETLLLLTAYCIDNCIQRHNISAADGVRIKYRLDGSLFNIRRLQAVTKVTNGTIFNLQYADDAPCPATRQMACSDSCMQSLLHTLAQDWPLTPKKTEVLYLPSDSSPHPTFYIKWDQLGLTEKFTYLGSIITSTCDLTAEIQHFNIVLT